MESITAPWLPGRRCGMAVLFRNESPFYNSAAKESRLSSDDSVHHCMNAPPSQDQAPEEIPRHLRPLRFDIVLLLLGYMVMQFLFGLLPSTWLGAYGDRMLLALGDLLTVFIYVKMKRLNFLAAVRLKPIPLRLLGAICLVAVGASGLNVLIGDYTNTWLGDWMPESLDRLYESSYTHEVPTHWLELLAAIWAGAIMTGISEELLFRGALQGTMERWRPFSAIGFSALLFALFHLNPYNFLGPLAFGIIFGVITIRSGSIIPAIICHAYHNSLGAVWDYAATESTVWPTELSIALACVLPPALWLFYYLTKNVPQQPSLLANARRLFPVTGHHVPLAVVSLASILIVLSSHSLGVVRINQAFTLEGFSNNEVYLYRKNIGEWLSFQPDDLIVFKGSRGKTHLSRLDHISDDAYYLDSPYTEDDVTIKIRYHQIKGKLWLRVSPPEPADSDDL